MTKTFLLLLFFISNNIYKVNGQNLFSEIKGSKIIIEDKTFSSLSFSVGLPIKIVKKECELYFENLGKINVVKKIIYHNISSNRKDYQKLELKTSIEKHNRKITINTTSETFDENDKTSIQNLFEGIKIILKRKFYQDHIFSLEKKIKKFNRKQNRLIRIQPKLLEKNTSFFYRLYQNNEVKKETLNASIKEMYSELEIHKSLIKNLMK